MWFVSILFFVILTIALICFSLANVGQVVPQVVLWGWGQRLILEDVSFVYAVLLAFFAGMALVFLTHLGRELGLKRRLGREARRRSELEQELAAIRHLPYEEPLPRMVRRDSRQ